MNTKHLLLGSAGVLGVGLAIIVMQTNQSSRFIKSKEPRPAFQTTGPVQKSESINPQPRLETALRTHDPLRKKELLKQWADSIPVDQIEKRLGTIDSDVDPDLRSEVRQILLGSWAKRNLSGMAAWFEKRYAADELHQESRDVLLKTLAERDPADSFSWMEKSLSVVTRQELYEPFFQQWAGKDPAAAAAKLRQIVEASPTDTGAWNNVVAQVATQWGTTDLPLALTWTQSLPESAAKSAALIQISYLWAAREPQAAADYAAGRNDPALLEAVACTWASKDPKNAVAWAFGLPEGQKRNGAVANAVTVWAQQQPEVAAAYIGQLSTVEARNQASLLVASAWSNADPKAAAKWIAQFPEGTVRELALNHLISTWTGTDASVAGQWLQTLAASRSRDVAVSAYCTVMNAKDPVVSFEWAKTIRDETIRTQTIETAAMTWQARNPVAPRAFK